ncbi:MAG: bifunctional isocitrate dehydrogenase kinase/phosphatase [Deltaproteobacteria bacterium]|nr:bifunctional isocitrate dehydrogenase kinase/phosphatase [Deltaproteobacteria bacterium]
MARPRASRDPTALTVARTILAGFDKHYRMFRAISAAARDRFERAAWTEVIAAHATRVHMYDQRVREGVAALQRRFPRGVPERLWPDAKHAYMGLLYGHLQPECAETFFNSVSTRVLNHRYFNNAHMFVRPAISTEHLDGTEPTYRAFYPRSGDLRRVLRNILHSAQLKNRFEDLDRDVDRLHDALRRRGALPAVLPDNAQLQLLRSPFFRNKAAYLVGRILHGATECPFAIPLLHNGRRQLFVDALLLDPADIASVFSLGRAYFMVDMEVPAAYVSFLQAMMPRKPRAELYTMLGLQKQGKTLFYRDLQAHLRHSEDHFVVAPGTHGMVMLVFTLPSFPYVFKVIRDQFDPPKETTPDAVRERYNYVKLHDRVGRLADTLEFSDVPLPAGRFDHALLEQFARKAPSALELQKDRRIVTHLYIERRVTPLDLHLREVTGPEKRDVIRGIGDCLKELAAADIFPGDLMLKNFGVTRYGRVVFYDYDELCPLTACNFRRLPEGADEGLLEPWFGVGAQDLFPEEFPTFMFADPEARQMFREEHPELCEPEWWQQTQAGVRAGALADLFPYPHPVRFPRP